MCDGFLPATEFSVSVRLRQAEARKGYARGATLSVRAAAAPAVDPSPSWSSRESRDRRAIIKKHLHAELERIVCGPPEIRFEEGEKTRSLSNGEWKKYTEGLQGLKSGSFFQSMYKKSSYTI